MIRSTYRVQLLTTLTAVVLLLVEASSAAAVDRFVAATGSDDGNDCSNVATPCRNVWFAVDVAADGDTVKVGAGKFEGAITSNAFVGKSTITVSGGWNVDFSARAPRTFVSVITRQRRAFVPQSLVDVGSIGPPLVVTLDGLTMTGGTRAAIEVSAGNDASVTVAIVDCTITANRGAFTSGIYVLSYETGAVHLVLDGSTLTRNRTTKAVDALGGGIGLLALGSSTIDVTLRNTLVYGNVAPTGAAAIGATVSGASVVGVSVVSSTVVGNRSPKRALGGAAPLGGAIGLLAGTGSAQLTLLDSIVWGNFGAPGKDVFADGSTGSLTVSAEHSIVGDRLLVGGTYTDLGGNLSVDPQLVNARRDLHLKATSPAIDAGTCAGAPALDFDGDPRPTGATCDIGADEHVP